MFKYVITVLFVSTYSRSFGLPTSPTATHLNPLSLSLEELTKSCKNPFIVSQIKSKQKSCVVEPASINEKFECLIFYDINTQLCDAIAASTLVITDESVKSAANINQLKNVTQLCNETNDWKITNITEYPKYKSTVEKVFSNPLTCAKVCGVEDLFSLDSNFFCKYFKWGSDLLKHQVSTAAPSSDLQPSALAGSDTNGQNISLKAASNNLESNPTNNKTGTETGAQSTTVKLKVLTKPEESKLNVHSSDKQNKTASNSVTVASGDNLKGASSDSALEEKDNSERVDGAGEAPLLTGSQPFVHESSIKKQDIETDDQGNTDLESEFPSDTDLEDEDQLPMEHQSKLESKLHKLEKQSPSNNGDKDTDYNTDGYPDDDDHFFPLFLTSVILVVLLYILYHNKNKVSKLFLGLIVEGRHPGRRRNSRGHAYRRLDTLEQAMSTNSAAPPSKIIY